jgi:hypothetical protein
VKRLESVTKFEDIDLEGLAASVKNKQEYWIHYLELFGEVDEHNVARRMLTTGGIQANSSDHINSAALDEVGASSEFEDLKAFVEGGTQDGELGYETVHAHPTYVRMELALHLR